ncbi:hypothetical protein VTL71DRAFT_6259 [Oculimacula yallundae]|uniref:Uncharacterized protein n=1 Tax=Oculimacula yallundae TaxID=86028 RepID=A0ABR4BZY7_9HELO
MLEEALEPADFAWVKATKADKIGNLFFMGTSYNLNTIMAMHVPGLYVNKLFKGEKFQHKIEVLKPLDNDASDTDPNAVKKSEEPRELIAHMAAREFKTGRNCKLGVGIPTMAAGFATSMGIHVFLQSENGMTGCGPYPERGKEDSDWINARKETVTILPGGSIFGSIGALVKFVEVI